MQVNRAQSKLEHSLAGSDDVSTFNEWYSHRLTDILYWQVSARGIERSHNSRHSPPVLHRNVFPTRISSRMSSTNSQSPSVTYAAQAVRGVMIENAVLSDKFLPMTTLAVSAIILYMIGVILYKRWVEKE